MKKRRLLSLLLIPALLFSAACARIVEEKEEDDTEPLPEVIAPVVFPGEIQVSSDALTGGHETRYYCCGIEGSNAAYMDLGGGQTAESAEEWIWGYYTFTPGEDTGMRRISAETHILSLTIGDDTLTAEYSTAADGTLLGGHSVYGGVTTEKHYASYGADGEEPQLRVIYADEESVICYLAYRQCADTLIYDLSSQTWQTLDGTTPTQARYDVEPVPDAYQSGGYLLYDPVCISPNGTRLLYRRSDAFGQCPASWYLYDFRDGTHTKIYEYSMERLAIHSGYYEEARWYSDSALALLPITPIAEQASDTVAYVECVFSNGTWQVLEYSPSDDDADRSFGEYHIRTSDDRTSVTVTSPLRDTAFTLTDLPQNLLPENPGTITESFYEWEAFPRLRQSMDGTEARLVCHSDTAVCVIDLIGGRSQSIFLHDFGLSDYKINNVYFCEDGYLLNALCISESANYIIYLPDVLLSVPQ